MAVTNYKEIQNFGFSGGVDRGGGQAQSSGSYDPNASFKAAEAERKRRDAEDKAQAEAGTAARGAALRSSSQSSNQKSSAPSAPEALTPAQLAPTPGSGVPTAGSGIGTGGPVGGVPPSVQKAALTGLSAGDQISGGSGPGGGPSGGITNSFSPGGASTLRANLGRRIYPQESYELAGLRKAY